VLLAGIVLALFGPAACYLVDALSWLAKLGALESLKTSILEGGGWRSVSVSALRDRLRFVRGYGVILSLMLFDFGAIFLGNVRGLFPIYARDILQVGPRGLGLLYASRAIGSLIAVVAMTLLPPIRRTGRWILIGVATTLFAGSEVFWFSVLMLALCGAGDTISSILRSSANQLSTPDAQRGRMSSINSLFTSSGPQLGQFESGVVAAWIGTKLSALTGGLATGDRRHGHGVVPASAPVSN
jgi:hypothetical protein